MRLLTLIGILTFLVSFITFSQPGNAQAALTLNNFVGFETNGFDEALSSSGSPTIQGTTVHSGDFALQMTGVETVSLAIITGGSSDSDNDFVVGYFIRFTNKEPSANFVILRVQDDTTGRLWDLILQTDSDLEVLNANGVSVGTITDPFTVGTFHLIEIIWQHLDSGTFDLHIDSVEKLSITDDFNRGNAIGPDNAVYNYQSSASIDYFLDDFYAYSGGTGTGDFLGGAEVFRYQNRENSTTSEATACLLANNLDQGVWQDLGETPLGVDSGVEPAFQATGDGGLIFTDDTASGDNGRHGPHGDANIDGDSNIRGAKWLHRLRRGNGAGGDQSLCFGNDAESVGSTVITLSIAFEYFATISTVATREPLSTEHFAQGMHTAAARDIEAEEFWSFILHVPDAAVTRRIFPVQ